MRKFLLKNLLFFIFILVTAPAANAALTWVRLELSGGPAGTISERFDAGLEAGILRNLPQGYGYTVNIYGEDESNNTIFTGTTTVNILRGATTSISLYDTAISLETAVSPLISAAEGHSLAQTSSGSLWNWGLNNYGQLGDGSTADSDIPIRVSQSSKLYGVKYIESDYNFSAALRYDGTVWTWGSNNYGQIGNGETGDGDLATISSGDYENLPSQVIDVTFKALTGISAVSVGEGHAAALKESNGSVWSWGNNDDGQLGNGSATILFTNPVEAAALTSITSISSGKFFTLALKNDGTVWAWGTNEEGELGDETQDPRRSPIEVHGELGVGTLSSVSEIEAGGFHSFVVKNDGTVWAWGSNDFGQLGINAFGTLDLTDAATCSVDLDCESWPVQVEGVGGFGHFSGIQAISAGNVHSAAIKDGKAYTWGYNKFGQLCNGDSGAGKHSDIPTPAFTSHSGITAVSAGFRHTLITKSDGSVWACGEYEYGQLGDTSYGDGDPSTADISETPVQALDMDLIN